MAKPSVKRSEKLQDKKKIDKLMSLVKEYSGLSGGHRCGVNECFNSSSQKGKSFYSFPKDVNMCKKWVEALNNPRENEQFLTKGRVTTRICSDHFEEKYLKNKDITSQGLFRHAVPTLNLGTKILVPKLVTEEIHTKTNDSNISNKNMEPKQLLETLKSKGFLSNKKCFIKVVKQEKPPPSFNKCDVIIFPHPSSSIKVEPPSTYEPQPSGHDVENCQNELRFLNKKLRNAQIKLRSTQKLVSKHKCNGKRKDKIISELRKELKVKNTVKRRKLIGKILPRNKITIQPNKAHRFTNSLKTFALDLYYSSPLSYNILEKIYFLPSHKTLKRWISQGNSSNILITNEQVVADDISYSEILLSNNDEIIDECNIETIEVNFEMDHEIGNTI